MPILGRWLHCGCDPTKCNTASGSRCSTQHDGAKPPPLHTSRRTHWAWTLSTNLGRTVDTMHELLGLVAHWAFEIPRRLEAECLDFVSTYDTGPSSMTNWIKVCCGLFLLGVERFRQNTGTPLSGILDGSCQCIDRIPSKQSKIKNHLARGWGYVFSTVCWLETQLQPSPVSQPPDYVA